MYKMYCVVSLDAVKLTKGIRGKFLTQAGHAYLHAAWDAEARFPADLAAYKQSEKAFKITCQVQTEEELVALYEKYKDICGATLVRDAGLTVFEQPTVTCIGIGPILVDKIDDDLSKLKLFV